MAAISNSTHKPTHVDAPDSQAPAVLNMRRPAGLTSEIHPAVAPPRTEACDQDEAPLPQTALRLPDLAAIVQRLPKNPFSSVSFGSIAQWMGIGLGALLALWLIFGGHGTSTTEGTTSSGEASQAASLPAWNPPPLAPEAPEAPRWQPPVADAPSLDAPAQPSAVKPSNDEQPGSPEWPAWDDAARRTAPPHASPPVAQQPAAYVAQRPEANQAPPPSADRYQSQPPDAVSGDLPPLGITVPVPQ
jgi:hypothetical protein